MYEKSELKFLENLDLNKVDLNNIEIKEKIDEIAFPLLKNLNSCNTNQLINETKGLVKGVTGYKEFMNKYEKLIISSTYKVPEILSYPCVKNKSYVSQTRQDYYKGFLGYNENNPLQNLDDLVFIDKSKANQNQTKNNDKEDFDFKIRRKIVNIENSKTNFNSTQIEGKGFLSLSKFEINKKTLKNLERNNKDELYLTCLNLNNFYDKNRDLLHFCNIETETYYDETLKVKENIKSLSLKEENKNNDINIIFTLEFIYEKLINLTNDFIMNFTSYKEIHFENNFDYNYFIDEITTPSSVSEGFKNKTYNLNEIKESQISYRNLNFNTLRFESFKIIIEGNSSILIDETLPFELIPVICSLNIEELKFFISQIISIRLAKKENIKDEFEFSNYTEEINLDLSRIKGFLNANKIIHERIKSELNSSSQGKYKETMQRIKSSVKIINFNHNLKSYPEKYIENSDIFHPKSTFSYDNFKTVKEEYIFFNLLTNTNSYTVKIKFPVAKMYFNWQKKYVEKFIDPFFCLYLMRRKMINWETNLLLYLFNNNKFRDVLRSITSYKLTIEETNFKKVEIRKNVNERENKNKTITKEIDIKDLTKHFVHKEKLKMNNMLHNSEIISAIRNTKSKNQLEKIYKKLDISIKKLKNDKGIQNNYSFAVCLPLKEDDIIAYFNNVEIINNMVEKGDYRITNVKIPENRSLTLNVYYYTLNNYSLNFKKHIVNKQKVLEVIFNLNHLKILQYLNAHFSLNNLFYKLFSDNLRFNYESIEKIANIIVFQNESKRDRKFMKSLEENNIISSDEKIDINIDIFNLDEIEHKNKKNLIIEYNKPNLSRSYVNFYNKIDIYTNVNSKDGFKSLDQDKESEHSKIYSKDSEFNEENFSFKHSENFHLDNGLLEILCLNKISDWHLCFKNYIEKLEYKLDYHQNQQNHNLNHNNNHNHNHSINQDKNYTKRDIFDSNKYSQYSIPRINNNDSYSFSNSNNINKDVKGGKDIKK